MLSRMTPAAEKSDVTPASTEAVMSTATTVFWLLILVAVASVLRKVVQRCVWFLGKDEQVQSP